MKKSGIINAELSKFIAGTGHTDKFLICDGGLPIPKGVPCIDLALCNGVPSFCQVAEQVLNEVVVEYYYLSEDIKEKNPKTLEFLQSSLPQIKCEMLQHNKFKEFTKDVKYIIRTGEFTPFANVILTAGVAFKV